ncbi:MAG: GIY-YIG nuclease family protein [Candidatus Omnitrophota bacterium]
MDYYVYALRSLKDGRLYIGFSKNPQERLRQHNDGMCRSTRNRRPFRLIYSELCGPRVEARRKEIWLKSGAGHSFLKAFG